VDSVVGKPVFNLAVGLKDSFGTDSKQTRSLT
jgi:hypothetical protein